MRSILIKSGPKTRRWGGYLLLATSAGLGSCDDLIEPDISTQPVALLAPADNTYSPTIVQHFEWVAVPNARTYHVQVATPSFAKMARLVLDSVVQRPTLTKALAPGQYEWRVQGVNAGYETAFTTRTLGIDSTTSLTNQVLLLTQPASGHVTNGAALTLSWGKLPMAQRYRLSVSPNPRNATLAALDSTVGTATTVTLRLARQSQVYQWKVTALNANTQAVSPTQTFEVDVTPPPAPTLTSPAAATSFLALPIALSWTRTAADVVQDSVFIYRADQTSLFTGYPRLSGTATLTLVSTSTPLISGTYYWAVRSLDKAGNLSPLSSKRAFLLQ